MKNIIIRQVDPDDFTGCHTVESRSFPPGEAAWATSITTRIETYPEGYLVAEQDGRIVGHMNSGSTHKDDISDVSFKQLVGHDPDGRNIVVFTLSVLPEHRGKGIAELLLNQFIELSHGLGKEAILLLCKEELIPFYQRFGFDRMGLSTSTHGNAVWHQMRLNL